MKLLPIDQEETQNSFFYTVPECLEALQIFPGHYKKVGFHKPWIGYFAVNDENALVGGCGFKGKPKDGRVEIAYGTFPQHQGKGVATQMCQQLLALAWQTDPTLSITARTLPDNIASVGVLKRNGFVCLGTVSDEEDGSVLEWELKINENKTT